jgi:hypothetical protein
MFHSIFLQDGGVLLTTYDIVRNNYKLIRGNSYNILEDGEEEGTLWNYVILDKGHLIKNNKTQRAQPVGSILKSSVFSHPTSSASLSTTPRFSFWTQVVIASVVIVPEC